MSTSHGSRGITAGVEIALAVASSLAAFTVVAVVLAALDSDVVAVLLGVAAAATVIAMTHLAGPSYAIPVAVATLVAFDWFQFPPTHAEEVPDVDNLLSLFAYFGVGVFAGQLAAYGIRRGEVSEAARSELAGEQAALRRIATIVATGAPQSEVFAAMVRELADLFGFDRFWMLRYDEDGRATVLATSHVDEALPVGSRRLLGGVNVTTRVAQTGRPARMDDVSTLSGPIGERVRSSGLRSVVGAPICSDARMWGVMVAGRTSEEPLPAGTEARLSEFTELMATAIANTESRAEAARLAEQQAALRRVATLVAKDAPPSQVFEKVADEAATVLGDLQCTIVRGEDSSTAKVIAVSGAVGSAGFPVGASIALEGEGVVQSVLRYGRTQRVDDYSERSEVVAEGARERGISSAVGCPIAVHGEIWGAIVVAAVGTQEPCPAGTEHDLAQFADLVATAIANAEARAEVGRLAEEQTALRRLATLVAEGVEPAELFDAVTKEVEQLFDIGGVALVPSIIRFDPGAEFVLVGTSKPQYKLPLGSRWKAKDLYVSTRVMRTRRSARVEKAELDARGGPDAELLKEQGHLYQVGSPVIVEGRLWGAMTINSLGELPPDTGARLEKFTEIVATAIANSDSREGLRRLADEQAALRRVATLVAERRGPEPVFAAVAEEVGTLFANRFAAVLKFEPDGKAIVMGALGGPHDQGAVVEPSRGYVVEQVRETGRGARLDTGNLRAPGVPAFVRDMELRSAVASPIVVGGELWGAITTASRVPLPPDAERRLASFTELLATAILNAEARSEVERLAGEQAALRRVATLVAAAAPPSAVFAAVVEEVGGLLRVDQSFMTRFDDDEHVTVVAGWRGTGDALPDVLPRQFSAGPMSRLVRETRGPVRLEPYPGDPDAAWLEGEMRSSVAAPVTVKGSLWGFISASQLGEDPVPTETEARLRDFTELVATAVANAESRTAVEQLADEQAALRRVATLVAEGAAPGVVFDAVTAEMEAVLDSDGVLLSRYEAGQEVTVLAHRGEQVAVVPVGTRLRHEPESASAKVRRTGAPTRMETYSDSHGDMGRIAETLHVRTAVATPVVVDRRLWGVLTAFWQTELSPPADTEQRMAKFAQLLDTAIANADSRDQLTASRVRLLTAADDARRRVVRDLHDGAQQRLVHSIITLKLAQRALHGDDAASPLIDEALEQAEQGNSELRELAHGILPSVLTRGGLRAGVDTVVARTDLPVTVDITGQRFAAEIEASAYFIVAEALTNVVKHACADSATVSAFVENGSLRIEVRDDGVGGADPEGHGLIGLRDRATALGGRLDVESPVDGGTRLAATLPISP